MPYIKERDRRNIENGKIPNTAGELNFQIYDYVRLCFACRIVPNKPVVKKFVDKFLGDNPNYQKYNDITGCLIRCKKEIERRFGKEINFLEKIMESYDDEIDVYEDEKIKENGDIR